MIRLRLLDVARLELRIKKSVNPEERVLLVYPFMIFFDDGGRLLDGDGLDALGGLILLGEINVVGVLLFVIHSGVLLSSCYKRVMYRPDGNASSLKMNLNTLKEGTFQAKSLKSNTHSGGYEKRNKSIIERSSTNTAMHYHSEPVPPYSPGQLEVLAHYCHSL